MNDTQRAILRSLADNKALFEALKEFLVEKFEAKIDPGTLSDAELGSVARAQFHGLKIILTSFHEISTCKSPKKRDETFNPAR